MKNPNKLWSDLAFRFAEQSRCRSRSVGCIITTPDGVMSGEGWNSPPRGSSEKDCIRCNGKYASGEHLELAICTHAEVNAIGFCARKGHPTEGMVIYTTNFPCKNCADLIIASGFKTLFYINDYPNMEMTYNVLIKAGVIINKLVVPE